MKRPWQIALAFALALAVVLAAMGWISREVLRLDRAQAEAKRLALREENVRLALWRMDSAVAPLLARENARPYFVYASFYLPELPYAEMLKDVSTHQRAYAHLPSPILVQTSPYIRLHFQIGPDGRLTSPQVPPPSEAAGGYVLPKYVSAKAIAAAGARLARLEEIVGRETLETALAVRPEPMPPMASAAQADLQQEIQDPSQAPQQQRPQAQVRRNVKEWQARYQQMTMMNRDINEQIAGNLRAFGAVGASVMRPVWIGGELLLVRWARIDGADHLQGVWLGWPAIRRWLLDGAADLVPQADLVPITDGPGEAHARRLAALPVRLVPGKVPADAVDGLSPVVLSLVVAWACVLAGAAAVGVLLMGAVTLSERRGDFVSAVTHELRTPLTTFRMYSEMLAEDMVADQDKRRRYLTTLCAEAERLAHMVENVLAYARLERGRASDEAERLTLADLVGRVRERLEHRAGGAGMELVVEVPEEAGSAAVWARVSAVDQILYNLVDNACKYAASASDRRIRLTASLAAGGAVLTVRDYGRGISRAEARRLFRPFSKSAREAATSAPGVGLGLALARRLARDMGGDLVFDRSDAKGASFTLQLLSA